METYIKVMNEAISKLSIIINELAKISVIEGIFDETMSTSIEQMNFKNISTN